MIKNRPYTSIRNLVYVPVIASIIGACGDYPERIDKGLKPLKDRFAATCSNKTDRTLENGELDGIIDERDEFLRIHGCNLGYEKWICARDSYNGVHNGSYSAAFIKTGNCECE